MRLLRAYSRLSTFVILQLLRAIKIAMEVVHHIYKGTIGKISNVTLKKRYLNCDRPSSHKHSG